MRVVVSLTTIPSRISGLEPTINSLLAQSRKPDEIALNLPRTCLKEKCGYDIPAWLWEKVSIYQCDRDYGPATKSFPAFLREQDPETRIITVDDDVIYSDNTVELLMKNISKSEDCIIGIMGAIWEKEGRHGSLFVHSEKVNGTECVVDTLGGYRGVCYRRGLIKNDIFSDFDSVCEIAGRVLLDDDAFMARYFEKNSIRRYVVAGMESKSDGELGFCNFEFASVPDGSGIFMNKSAGHHLGEHARALREYYGY
jgi:hypothetical protein